MPVRSRALSSSVSVALALFAGPGEAQAPAARGEAPTPAGEAQAAQAAQAAQGEALAALPWGDVAPRVVGDAIEVAALGMPDERIGSWPARRQSARRRGLERARAHLVAWLDEQLAPASPRVAADVHAALRDAVQAHAVRALADGAAVVVARVELARLRAAWGEGAPR